MKLVGELPSHIDGHNHVHMVPGVATIIAEIMACYWGIYKVRISEEVIMENTAEFEPLQREFIDKVRFFGYFISN